MSAAAEVRRRASADDEEPFLFFRDAHGHFRWWSWGHVERTLERCAGAVTAAAEPPGSEAALDLLCALTQTGESVELPARALLERLGAGSERDVWISFRPLDEVERTLAMAGLIGGWAILREPVEPLPPSTVAWARPTILAAPATALDVLLAGLAREAPRPWGARWLRRRLARLRAVVTDDEAAVGELAGRLNELGAPARVLTLRAPGW